MQPPQQHSWINLSELKGQLIRKLGPERAKQYFYYLNRFLSLKLSKAEFNKLCIRTVGKDNIPLHNQLIRSVLKNACTRKVPPSKHDGLTRAVGTKNLSGGVYHQNGSNPAVTHVSSPLALPNGDILPPSPRKARSGTRERRGGDRRSALGPNGKTNHASFLSPVSHSGDFSTTSENGIPSSLQHRQELTQQENGDEVLGCKSAKFPAPERSPSGLVSVRRKAANEACGRTSLHAPLGVNIGGVHRAFPLSGSSKCVGVSETDGLLDTITLKERMEQIALAQGLQGVPMDCANALNNALDAYLKNLIRSCAELNGARSANGSIKNVSVKHQALARPLNGVKPVHHYQIQSGNWPLDAMQGHEPKHPISLLDFRVAMELNPQQLGEDRPIMLEKICTHAFEE